MTTTNLHLLEPQQQAAAPAPELLAKQQEAALIAQVRNATIAECQRWLRESANVTTRAAFMFTPELRQSFFDRCAGYRSAADLLEALRS